MKRGWLVAVLTSATVVLVANGCANKYVTSGKIAMNQKNYDKAINDFNMALKDDSTIAVAHFLLGKCYQEKKDYTSMTQHYSTAERLDPKLKDEIEKARTEVWGTLFTTGTENAKKDKFEDALKAFQTAITVIPQRYEAYTNAGYVWQKLGNNDSAYAYYSKAYSLDQSNFRVLESLAALLFNQKNYDRADSLYAILLHKDSTNAEAFLRRAEIADQQQRYNEAVELYNKTLQLQPRQCDVWFNLGVIFFQRLQKPADAEQAFRRAVDLCPQDINAEVNLNVVLIFQNKLDDAIGRLKAFTQANPQECTGWDLLSQALLKKGLKQEAYAASKKYEDCQERDVVAVIIVLIGQNKLDDAIMRLNSLTTQNPKECPGWDLLSQALKKGQEQEALDIAKKIDECMQQKGK
jgi:superkiller protein 3